MLRPTHASSSALLRLLGPCRRCLVSAKHTGAVSQQVQDDDKMPFYALGTNLALRLGGQGNSIRKILKDNELDLVLEGFCDTFRGKQENKEEILAQYGPAVNEISKTFVQRIKKEGVDFRTAFLDANENAIKLESGLVYLEVSKGEGKQPTMESIVEVHYHGTLSDGTVFDSSVDRGRTVKFMLASLVSGWQEGLLKMKEGGRATLIIPPELAYGDQVVAGETLPPGSTLKFEIELFKVEYI